MTNTRGTTLSRVFVTRGCPVKMSGPIYTGHTRPSSIPTSKSRIQARQVSFTDESNPTQAIRKKIESELSRKRTISTPHRPAGRRTKTNVQKGTVAALKPSPALTVPENLTVSEASQLCAAKRTDCVLVVDDEEGLSGIFTAKDLAYRVSPNPYLYLYCN